MRGVRGGVAVVPIDEPGTVYPVVLVPLLIVLAGAGISIAAWSRTAPVAGVVAGITAIHVIGVGTVATRDWFNYAGATGLPYERTIVASGLAIVMTFVAITVTVISLWLLRSEFTRQKSSPSRWLPMAVGVVVATATPALPLIFGRWYMLTAYGQFALWWSLPWGAGLALTGWLRPIPARTARLTVAASMVLTAGWALGAFWNIVTMPVPS